MDSLSVSADLQKSASLIEQQKYAEAIEEIKSLLSVQSAAEKYALLGLAYFRSEQYSAAADAYTEALRLDPSNAERNEMLKKCRENSVAEVNVAVPDISFFEREKLLQPPVVKSGSIPTDALPKHARGDRMAKFRLFLGNFTGTVFTAVFEALVTTWGAIAGISGKVWTNWYRRPLFLGILTLAEMRNKLNKHNLQSTYPENTLIGFLPNAENPPAGVQYYRTANGTWNNIKNPKEGAAGTRLFRNVSINAVKPESGNQLLSPNPREISRKLLTREKEMKEVPFLNMLAACWIQFQNADWINHGEPLLKEIIEVPLSENDPARKKYLQTKMLVPRTQPDPTRMEKENAAISFVNEVTHWWDGSQIYGSDQETVDRLRSHVDGKLRLNSDGSLPLNNKGIEETGFVRNWWVGMSMMHTLFTREHNAICDHLKSIYTDWDDTRLFNVARLINAACMAKIHSVEWTPAILPNQGLDTALNANWYGILTNLFQKKGKNKKTVSEINVRNPELGGVVGNPINKHGVSYAFTEEFVEVYRLHSLLPETLQLKKNKTGEKIMEVPFPETRQAGAGKLLQKVSMTDLFYSFGNQHPGQLVLNNYPRFMQELSIPFNPVFDMGAVDIIRARERGVPRYNEFRRQLGLNPITAFEDLTDDTQIVQQLKDIYGTEKNAVETLDLLIGTLAEGHRPSGFGFGETMFQIFILNATRRLQSDRFYTDCFTDAYYTKEGMEWIDKADLKSILLRHYPELASSGLANVKNAFEPWDTEKNLDPARHPLRKWDKTLKNGPWVGDAY